MDVIHLIFFIPLFYLTMSSGLPPGTFPATANPTPTSKEQPIITWNKTTPNDWDDSRWRNSRHFINRKQTAAPFTSRRSINAIIGLDSHSSTNTEPSSPAPILDTNFIHHQNENISHSSHDHHHHLNQDDVDSTLATSTESTAQTPTTTTPIPMLIGNKANGEPDGENKSKNSIIGNRFGAVAQDPDQIAGKDESDNASRQGNMTGIVNGTTSLNVEHHLRDHPENNAAGPVDDSRELAHNHSQQLPFHSPLVQNYTYKVPLRGSCNSTFRCLGEHVECHRGHCRCQDGYAPSHDERDICRDLPIYNMDLPQTDPTMIGVIIGLILMSFTLCIVLRLFAKARFRENRTIFNTPNPRLMNASLLKGGKQLLRGNSGGPPRSRGGSTASIQSAVDAETTQHKHSGAAHAAGSPTSPQNETGNGKPGRPKTLRQLSTDTASNETVGVTRGAAPKYKYRQDSLSSNV